MIPSYLDGDADIGIEDIDKINTALFNLEETISTYKPQQTKQDYGVVSIHRELLPGEILQFDPPVYETPVIATIGGNSVYIGTLNRKGLLNITDFKGLDSVSGISEVTSETTTAEFAYSNKDTYERHLNTSYEKTVIDVVKQLKLKVSKETYQIYEKYYCAGIKCEHPYKKSPDYYITFITGLYKNCRNSEGRECTIEIKINSISEYIPLPYTYERTRYYFTSTKYEPIVSYYYSKNFTTAIKSLGVPRNEQEWNNWKTQYGKYLVRTGAYTSEGGSREYWSFSRIISSNAISITQSFDVKGRDMIYVDADVLYRRA